MTGTELYRFTLDLPHVGDRDYLQALALVGEGLDHLAADQQVMQHSPVIRRMACHGPASGQVLCQLFSGQIPKDQPQPAAILSLDSTSGPLRLAMTPTGQTTDRVPDQQDFPPFTPTGELSGTVPMIGATTFRQVWQVLYAGVKGALETRWPRGTSTLVFLQATGRGALDPSIIDSQTTLHVSPGREFVRDDGIAVVFDVLFQQQTQDDYRLSVMCAALDKSPW
ncbi:MAG: hypothetical protein Alpg2KO_17690 [Alphaproteobacteria bacterium]